MTPLLPVLPAASAIPPSPPVIVDGESYPSIQAALDAAPAGEEIELQDGHYRERLVVSKDCFLVSASGVPGAVTISWETTAPYQSTIQVTNGAQAGFEGISVRHSSPSVANNYAIFLQSASCSLTACDISSSTGSGIGIEGGFAVVSNCDVHGCARHGIVAASNLEMEPADVEVVKSRFNDNAMNGALVLDGSSVLLTKCTFKGNGHAGLELRDCVATLDGCVVEGNGRNSLTVLPATELSILGETADSFIQPGVFTKE